MDNVKDIAVIIVFILVGIGMVYQLFHMDDLAKGLNELENFKRCQEDPEYEKAFLEYHSKLIEESKFPERKIPKWKMWWMDFCMKYNLHL